MASTGLLGMFPETITADEPFSRAEEAMALTKAFFHIVEEWQLSADEARILLGHPGKSRFYDLRKLLPRAVHALSDDEMDRLAYLTGIYYGLGILFSPENTLNWLRNTAQRSDGYQRPWGMEAPLSHILTGKMADLIDVYRYVNGMRGSI